MATFMPFLNINTTLTPSQTNGNPSKNVLLIGQRNTAGALIPSVNGFDQPDLYKPFLPPSFQNGIAALQYLANFGIKYQMGINFSLSLPAPTSVTTNTPSTGLTTLSWSTIPAGFSQLTDFALTGTLSQGTTTPVNAPAKQATISNGTANLVVYGTPAFTTTTALTLTGINNIQYPDPNASDPIALMVWDFYETALSAFPSAQGAPATYVSILSDRDPSISPNPEALTLAQPTSVVVNLDGSVSLIYNYTTLSSLANFGYLPTTTLGVTSVKQGTATGIYGGYTLSQEASGGTVTVLVTNVSGTFTDTAEVDITLDNTQNAFQFLNFVDIHSAVQQFPINDMENVTETYVDFYNGINLLNEDDQTTNNHYLTYGIAGNITSLPSNAANLPAPNSNEYILTSYPYVAKFGDIPYDNALGNVASGRIASAVAYMLANGDAPYPALLNSTINHLPVSSVARTTSYSANAGGTGDIAVEQGWIPLASNQFGQVRFLQSITTMTTLPGTQVPDIEFGYTHVWDCVRWLKYQIAQLYNSISVLPNNQGSAIITPAFLTQFRTGIISILFTGQALGVFQNVDLYQNRVKTTQDSQNPNEVDAYVPSQIIPQLNGANVMINVFSSLIQFQGA